MQFLPKSACVITNIWMHNMDSDQMYREKVKQELDKNAQNYIQQILSATSHKIAAVWPPTSHF